MIGATNVKELKLVFDNKVGGRIEKTAKKLQVDPAALCLHFILEKLEEAGGYSAPTLIVSERKLKQSFDDAAEAYVALAKDYAKITKNLIDAVYDLRNGKIDNGQFYEIVCKLSGFDY